MINRKTTFHLILLFSIFALSAAYFIEYILGHQPCNLCLIERIPYIVSIVIILLFIFIQKFERFFLIILSITFIIALVISFYHFGIEQGFIKESLVCDLNSNNADLTKEALLNQLQKVTVSCKDATFRILGFSLATINIFISLIIATITIKLFLTYEKNK
ncbi:disulfide bond formation protein B [Candidatus Pelagibacter giovannonii]|uniref:Disulfide bond formation protein B n=1 Tax=Candidatus Pelagibacter giovannonii TaxID=2563896 RepID=A0A6H1Q3P3_9PROT|nr:disulfide bond formation protein B [Candidatus Pelagibacter giovannonii]QIZ20983.1 disulfide bond formation protein B [Candidatus Pelagibacter giovannonii]